MKEKRRFQRLESKDKAILRKEKGEQQEGLLLDISQGGMRVLLDNDIKIGSPIYGQFKILPHLGHFYVRGEVVWVKPAREKNKTPTFAVGVKFCKVSTISL